MSAAQEKHDVEALDGAYHDLDSEELAFFLKESGIHNEEELKRHLCAVQAKAYKVYPYPCIRHFNFTKLKISRLPAYQSVLKIGKEDPEALLLDIGCCFGNDTRKAIADGFPQNKVIASDLRKDFWTLGHELFDSTPHLFPVPFIEGDAFDPSILEVAPPVTERVDGSVPDLNSLKSLNPLRGRVSAIHASSFLHLFDEDTQLVLAKALAGLLSFKKGSILFGSQVGSDGEPYARNSKASGLRAWNHTPSSWIAMWDGQVFPKGVVKVEAITKSNPNRAQAEADPDTRKVSLIWSVTRL